MRTPPLENPPWTIVIPFKGSPEAKSRLSVAAGGYPALENNLRLRFARAFVQDTVQATLRTDNVGDVIVVSSDAIIVANLPNTITIPDPGKGLNAAITAGLAHAEAVTPHAPVAVMTGDLPGLNPADLQAALRLAAQYPRCVVADHTGAGTTTLTGLPGERLIPRFGNDSHYRHQQDGHHSLAIPLDSTLRQDVDTPIDLRHALTRGVGEATRAVVHAAQSSLSDTSLPAASLERTP